MRPAGTASGKGLCLGYDFNGVSGHAAMRRELPIVFPTNYQFDFRIRGSGPANQFEFKLVDASGENVWWVSKPATVFPSEWSDVRYKARHITPAWGPLKDKTLRATKYVEFTIYANEGGNGEVCIADLRFAVREPQPPTWPALKVVTDSGNVGPDLLRWSPSTSTTAPSRHGHKPEMDPATGWRTTKPRRGVRTLTLDFSRPREFGALALRWTDGEPATRYDVDFSDDGRTWRTVRKVDHGNGGIDHLLLTESDTRWLRLVLRDGPASHYTLSAIDVRDTAIGANPNTFLQTIAAESPRGRFPRGFSGEQTYWTLVGIDGGHESALIGEDGAIELSRGAPSITPFAVEETRCPIGGIRPAGIGLLDPTGIGPPYRAGIGPPYSVPVVTSWTSVATEHGLIEGYLPMPAVKWPRSAGGKRCHMAVPPSHRFTDSYLHGPPVRIPWRLQVDAFAQGTPESSRVFVRYTLTNDNDLPGTLTLALAIQPFQVNPPVQFLTTPGGVSPIHQLGYEGGAVNINGKPRIWPLTAPTQFFATPFDQDMAAQHLAYGDWPTAQSVDDPTGLASGALLYTVKLNAHESRTISLAIPLTGTMALPRLAPSGFEPWVDAQRDAVAAEWREKLDRVKIKVPPSAQPIVDTLRTALAHILINRDGVQIRPGTRSYARSWIRDGAMTSEALLRMGHDKEARDFLEWFAPYQFANGKVPCCVDKRGADPVPENDSHGELIFLAAEVFRYGGDRQLAEAMWAHVDKAARYMDTLRASERVAANRGTSKFGLLPPSISHEGYSAKPAYSHWDNFWGLIGYKGALALAEALGKDTDAKRLAASRDQFRADIVASIEASAREHGIDFIPGAADLGDFDATSTTIALSPGGEREHLPKTLLLNTFERYWREFVERRDGRREWKDYTPYEWRNVSAFVRLGWRERAHEAIAFFFGDRRPAAWNQWAEVVGRDYREPRFIGDMPHGWVASDFIRAALDLFAYERESDQSLVLAAGIPETWLDGDGVAIDGLRTPYGTLSYSLQRDDDTLQLRGSGQLRLPPGGIVLALPRKPDGNVTIDGRRAKTAGSEIRIRQWPADVRIGWRKS